MARKPSPAARRRFRTRKQIRDLHTAINQVMANYDPDNRNAVAELILFQASVHLGNLQTLIQNLDAERDAEMAQRAIARLPDDSVFDD